MEEKVKDRISYFIASKLPKRVLYHCLIYIWSILTTRVYTSLCPDEIDVFLAMEGWERKYGINRDA